MKKVLSIIIAAFASCTVLTAQPSHGIAAMDSALAQFLRSTEVLTKTTTWSPSMNEYFFKYTVPDDGQPIQQADIERLVTAFEENATGSVATYTYNTNAGQPLFSGILYKRKDNFFDNIYGNYPFTGKENFRIVNFMVNKQLTSYGLLWQERQFNDRHGQPFRTIDGQLFKFFDGIWEMTGSTLYTGHVQPEKPTIPINQDALQKQVKSLCKLYAEHKKAGDEQSCDAAVYFLQKLCADYEGRLNEQQFTDINEDVKATFLAGEKSTSERSRIVKQAIKALASHAETPLKGTVEYTYKMACDRQFIKPDEQFTLWVRYEIGDSAQPRVQMSLTGSSAEKALQVSIHRMYPSRQPYVVEVKDGRFEYNGWLEKDQLVEISDQQGNKMVIIADDVPTEIDLQRKTLRGSRQNERFAEYQRRLDALRPEMNKYATAWDNDWTVIDTEGYNRLVDEARHLQMEMAAENKDNMIPVWYLVNNYFAMSLDELAPFMQHSLPYANHVVLQPVWQHYEGLKKRPVGGRFIDGEAVDTAGVAHRLSEYIGQGKYTVLCFWDMTSRKDMKTLKKLSQTCSNLTIVCVTLDENRQSWAKYVRKRDFHFINLQPADIGEKSRWAYSICQDYGIATTLPETILFSPDGRIVARGLFGESLEAAIRQLDLH